MLVRSGEFPSEVVTETRSLPPSPFMCSIKSFFQIDPVTIEVQSSQTSQMRPKVCEAIKD